MAVSDWTEDDAARFLTTNKLVVSGSSSPYLVAGGGGGGYYSTGVYSPGGYGTGYQPLPPIPPLLTSPPFAPLSGSRSKLSLEQLERLMDHQYVPMEPGQDRPESYCLMCYVLDTYRTRGDHQYVISEE